jgi:hypothetical protein
MACKYIGEAVQALKDIATTRTITKRIKNPSLSSDMVGGFDSLPMDIRRVIADLVEV